MDKFSENKMFLLSLGEFSVSSSVCGPVCLLQLAGYLKNYKNEFHDI